MERVAIMVVDGGLPLAEADAAHGRQTRRQTPMERPAVRENMARRAAGWDWQAAAAGLEYGRQRHTTARRQTTMDTDDTLRSLFGTPWRTS